MELEQDYHLQGLESAQEYIRLKQERELLYNKLKEIEQELQERENNKTR